MSVWDEKETYYPLFCLAEAPDDVRLDVKQQCLESRLANTSFTSISTRSTNAVRVERPGSQFVHLLPPFLRYCLKSNTISIRKIQTQLRHHSLVKRFLKFTRFSKITYVGPMTRTTVSIHSPTSHSLRLTPNAYIQLRPYLHSALGHRTVPSRATRF